MNAMRIVKLVAGLALVIGLVVVGYRQFSGDTATAGEVVVWKSPTCGCCEKWADHLRANGFRVVVHDVEDLMPVKQSHRVPDNLHACHTAEIAGYTIEGHVPAAEVKRLIAEKPAARGIAVAGMPIGSPGMEQGSAREAYDVVLFDDQRRQSVFRRY